MANASKIADISNLANASEVTFSFSKQALELLCLKKNSKKFVTLKALYNVVCLKYEISLKLDHSLTVCPIILCAPQCRKHVKLESSTL